jgi:hypothetical protein
MITTLTINETAKPALRQLDVATRRGVAASEIGRNVLKLVRDHFYALPPNDRHFPSTHFWQRAAEATRYEVTPEGVNIRVNQIGIRQRLLGGAITPKRGKFLTIPAIAETYGHSAREFGRLKFVRCPGSTHYSTLGLAPESAVADKSGAVDPGSVYFWLVRSMTQEPDPAVLPSTAEIRATATRAAKAALK